MRSLPSLEEARNSYERNPNKYIENLLIIDETFSQIISDEMIVLIPFFEDNLKSSWTICLAMYIWLSLKLLLDYPRPYKYLIQ